MWNLTRRGGTYGEGGAEEAAVIARDSRAIQEKHPALR